MTEADRFMKNVSPEPNSGCWLWTGGTRGGKSGRPYGLFYCDGVDHYAHRRALQLFRSTDVAGKLVTHSCDVNFCVNPDHLRIGTHATNVQEAWDRGRQTRRSEWDGSIPRSTWYRRHKKERG
jgi:hypothetical protein